MVLLGIDLGGSAIKAGVVDVAVGRLLGEALLTATPQPCTPAAVMDCVVGLAARRTDCDGAVGFAFPSVVEHGIARTAAHVDPSWIGVDGARLLREATGRPAAFINDADAAGLAEMRFGAGRGERGTVLVLTLGTGIGSAIFVDGCLWPNTELGHLEIGGREAEQQASARTRTVERLDWVAWSARVNRVLAHLDALLRPDLYVVGGGVVEHWHEFSSLLRTRGRILPAALGNHAGIIGAALHAAGAAR